MPTGIPKKPNGGKWAGHNRMSAEEKKRRNAARSRAWHKAKPEHARSTKLMKAYGITHQDYLDLKGNGGCFICGNECPSGRSLAIDHDHKLGHIRGLLCVNCNKGLGNFKDNVQLLSQAIQYLRFYQESLREQQDAVIAG